MDNPVECHSGFDYAERPTAIHWEAERLEVVRLVTEWRTPEGKGFRVQVANGRAFELFYNQGFDHWEIREV